jgi:hypothetical protein
MKSEVTSGGTCPSSGDELTIQAFISTHTDAIAVALHGGALPTGTVAAVLKTGQTTCYDSTGTAIACAGTAQDGELQRGLSRGYVDNGDGTVTDTTTNLVWEKQSRDGSIHDSSNLYTWDDAFSAHVGALNAASFAGHSDWRLPNVNELQSLVDYRSAYPAMAIDAVFNTNCAPGCTVLDCSCVQGSPYWTSTSYLFAGAGGAGSAFTVSFFDGVVYFYGKTVPIVGARAVRGGS